MTSDKDKTNTSNIKKNAMCTSLNALKCHSIYEFHIYSTNTNVIIFLCTLISQIYSFWTGAYWGNWIHRIFGFNTVLRDVKTLEGEGVWSQQHTSQPSSQIFALYWFLSHPCGETKLSVYLCVLWSFSIYISLFSGNCFQNLHRPFVVIFL